MLAHQRQQERRRRSSSRGMSLQWSFSCLCQDFGWAAGLSLPLPLPLLMLLCCWYCGCCFCCCCCWQMEHIWLHPKQRKQTDAEIYIRKNGHPSGEYKTCKQGGGEGTRINAWILMACQPVHFKLCAARGRVSFWGESGLPCPGRRGPEQRQAEEGLALSCFPVVLHWHLGNIIRWHRQQLCIHYVHISCFVDPNRFRCYFTRHSLRFVYVNIYVKCALGFYKCHRGIGKERER